MAKITHFEYLILGILLFMPLPASAVEVYQVADEYIAEVSAFTSAPEETDNDPWTTASGKKTTRQTLACPSRYKFGVKVAIDGEVFVCEDRMNKRYRDKKVFDKWVETKKEAYAWGRRKILVRILKPETEMSLTRRTEMSFAPLIHSKGELSTKTSTFAY